MTPHPRLYLTPAHWHRLQEPLITAYQKAAAKYVAVQADEYVKTPIIEYDQNIHNSLLIRARAMQMRVVTLLTRWRQTDKPVYRDAAIAHIMEMGRWEFWGWESWRRNDPRPDAEFDLSYGENSATIAMAYDVLFDSLSVEQRRAITDIATQRALTPFLVNVRRKTAWWFEKNETNWNTVCAGGAGMLALAMYEESPDAEDVLALVEQSIRPYMAYLKQTGGGWPEGLSYWNYGMRYAFIYLLSHEASTGQKHPAMDTPEVKATLEFPLWFSPNNIPCSFGDLGGWGALPVHFEMAVRVNDEAVLADLAQRTANAPIDTEACWANAAEALLLEPRTRVALPKPQRSVSRIFGDSGWGVLADQMPYPNFFFAIRGGSTARSHAQNDLLSFHCVVGDEKLITNVSNTEYLDTTFGPRRNELFEISPASKNTILINGLGIVPGTAAEMELIGDGGLRGIRLDVTSAMGPATKDRPALHFCGRVFLMLDDRAMLILDRVELVYPGRVESRMYTGVLAALDGDVVRMTGQRSRLNARYACDVPAILLKADAILTTPIPGAPPPAALRWCTTDRTHKIVTMATLLSPGEEELSMKLHAQDEGIAIDVKGTGWAKSIHLSPRLQLQH